MLSYRIFLAAALILFANPAVAECPVGYQPCGGSLCCPI
jgi:hypothetical protein